MIYEKNECDEVITGLIEREASKEKLFSRDFSILSTIGERK